MRIDFAFGKTGLSLELPGGFHYQVLEARSATPLPDPLKAIDAALDLPTGCEALETLARGKKSAAISVCDITRPAPNRVVLPPVLARLRRAGIPTSNITICIATGLHRHATAEEIRQILADEIAAAYPVWNHDARQLEDHRHLGHTRGGTPVYIDEHFVSADLRITLGFIEPHFMAGFSGGRKLVAPGLAARETITVLHSPPFMRHPNAVEGHIDGNPLHEELIEIARMARQDFIVDVSLSRSREISGVFAGHPEQAHAAGVEFVSQSLLEIVDEAADAVITTSAGYPLDLTFYQTVKGIHAAAHIVKPGGRILLLAACDEGAGAPEFRQMLRTAPAPHRFLDSILDKEVVIDQWQLEKYAMVAGKADILLYIPGLPGEYHDTLWGQVYPTAARAVEALTAGLPAGARIAVVPEGPYVFATTRAAAGQIGSPALKLPS